MPLMPLRHYQLAVKNLRGGKRGGNSGIKQKPARKPLTVESGVQSNAWTVVPDA